MVELILDKELVDTRKIDTMAIEFVNYSIQTHNKETEDMVALLNPFATGRQIERFKSERGLELADKVMKGINKIFPITYDLMHDIYTETCPKTFVAYRIYRYTLLNGETPLAKFGVKVRLDLYE